MTRLSPVLSRTDFAEAELCSLRLDGEVYRVDDCAAAIDEIESAAQRAAALRRQLPDRLIAERLSAAWVWGALADPPAIHEVCSDIEARTRPTVQPALRIREVVIDGDEVAWLAGIQVTTPLRTAIDLARFSATWSLELSRTISRLMAIGQFTAAQCSTAMNRRRNLPGKVVALERLARTDAVDVVDGVDATHRVEHAVEVRGVAHFKDESAEREAVA
jgi:hypothetical protein